MTLTKTLKLAMLLVALTILSCSEKKPKVIIDNQNTAAAVPHYICANQCEGGFSDVAGPCKTCNEALLHNDAFHAGDFLKNGPLNVPKFNDGQTTNNAATTSPARNAQGIYHYTCNNGCVGGSGTAEKCKVCGEDLAHNQAYHN